MRFMRFSSPLAKVHVGYSCGKHRTSNLCGGYIN